MSGLPWQVNAKCLEQHRLITCQQSAFGTRSSNFPSSAVGQNRWPARWISPNTVTKKSQSCRPSSQVANAPFLTTLLTISRRNAQAGRATSVCGLRADAPASDALAPLQTVDGLKGGELSVLLSHDRNTKSWFVPRRKRRYCSTTRFAAAASRSKAILSGKLSSKGLMCASKRRAAAKTRRIRLSVGSGLEMTNLPLGAETPA